MDLIALPMLTSAAVLFVAIYGLFDWLEKNSSSNLKREVSIWIRQAPTGATAAIERTKAAWVLLFSSTFDRTFGAEPMSWKRIVRSWAISSIVVIALTLLWALIRPDQFWALFEKSHQDVKDIFSGVVLSAYLFNLVPDYISALQTQYFVRFIRDKDLNWASTLGVVVGDFVSKTVIFLVFYCIAVMSLFSVFRTFFKDVRGVWDAIVFNNPVDAIGWFVRYGPTLSVEKNGNLSIGIFYYSTFFPSVWLWILILGSYAFRLMYLLVKVGIFANWSLRVEEHPLRSLGAFAAAICTLVYVIVEAIRRLL